MLDQILVNAKMDIMETFARIIIVLISFSQIVQHALHMETVSHQIYATVKQIGQEMIARFQSALEYLQITPMCVVT